MASRTTRRAGRGRRVLLWAVGAFLALQVTASALLDYRWPAVRFPFFFHQATRVDAFPTRPTIMCFGSSRFGCLFEEEEITAVVRQLTGDPEVQFYNASIPAGDLIVSEKLLARLIERGVRPRYAVIELVPEVVNHRNEWIKMHVGRQICWGDVPTYLTEVTLTGNLLRLAGTRFLPLWTYRDEVRQEIGKAACAWYDPPAEVPTPGPELSWWARAAGPKAPPGPAADWSRLIADSLRDTRADPALNTTTGLEYVDRALRRYRPGGTAAAALERMLALCRAHEVEPILLGVPLTSAHRRHYTPEIETQFQAYVADLTRAHGCRFVDFRARVPDHFFVDHHHASAAGKMLFSRIVGVELLAPAWTAGAGGAAVPATLVSRPKN